MKSHNLPKAILFGYLMMIGITLIGTRLSFANQGYVDLSCQIELQTNVRSLTLSGWRYYNQIINKDIRLPISSRAGENHIILDNEELSSYFGGQRIIFLGSAHIDPITNIRKLFIGMYRGYNTQTLGINYFFNLPYLNDDRQDYYSIRYGVPIASAVSDSGTIEVFSANFQRQEKLSLKCRTSDSENYITNLVSSVPRHQFTCNINLTNHNQGQRINEINKQVIIGFSNESRNDLQPIIEDEHISSFLSALKIMGNLYINPDSLKPELLIGFYRMSRFYSPERHSDFYTVQGQTRNGEPGTIFYALPIAEVRTESDYAELRSAITGSIFLKTECKKLNNRMTWLEHSLN